MPSIDDSMCVLVTGATSGIGRSLALDIAQLPSRPQVIAAGRRKERLDELAKVDNVFPVALDVASDFATLKKTVDDVVVRFSDVYWLVLTLLCDTNSSRRFSWIL